MDREPANLILKQENVEYRLHDMIVFDGTDPNGKRVDKHGIIVGYELVAYDNDPKIVMNEVSEATRFYYRVRVGNGIISVRPGQIFGIDLDRN